MKKTGVVVLFTFFFLAHAHAVLALDIIAEPSGRVSFYSSSVLGENINESGSQSEPEKKPSRVLPAYGQQQVRVAPVDGQLKIETSNRATAASMENTEKAPRVRLEKPTKATQLQERMLQQQKQEEASPSVVNKVYLEQLKTTNQERSTETVELRNRLDDKNRQGLELKAHDKAARLVGAEFSYDQSTNQVTVVAPNGKERTLNHLPDQALTRIQEFTANSAQVSEGNLEVLTQADGSLVYKTKATTMRKILGIFPNKVESEVTLEDSTGKVTSQEQVPSGFFNRLFYSMSK